MANRDFTGVNVPAFPFTPAGLVAEANMRGYTGAAILAPDSRMVQQEYNRLVPVIAVNSINSASAGTVYTSNGTLYHDPVSGDQKNVLLYWEYPLVKCYGFMARQSTLINATWTLTDSSGHTLGNFDLTITGSLVVQDWDKDTVNWTTGNALATKSAKTYTADFSIDSNLATTGATDSNITFTPHDKGSDPWIIFWIDQFGADLTEAELDASKRFFGAKIAIAATIYEGDAQSVDGVIDTTIPSEGVEAENFGFRND